MNLSRFAQSVELDLSRFSGCIPIEIFSRNPFPSVKKSLYILTLGPHSHYWFVLQPQSESRRLSKKRVVPTLSAPAELRTLLNNGQRAGIEGKILPEYIRNCRWFGAKARTLRDMRVREQSPISAEPDAAEFWFVEVSYLDGPNETYALPVKIAVGDAAHSISQSAPHAVIARFDGVEEAILFDAVWDAEFREKLFRLMLDRQRASGKNGQLIGSVSAAFAQNAEHVLGSNVISGEQSNSSMLFENKFFLKLYRKLEDGVNPDVEVVRFLTERTNFPNVPSFGGAIEYRRGKSEPTVVCLLQSAV